MTKVRQVTCAMCGGSFDSPLTPGRPPKNAVCEGCAVRLVKPCASCGMDFAPRYSAGQRFSYCPDCAKAENKRHRSGKKLTEVMKPKNCLRCGVEFAPTSRRSRCCSRNCLLSVNEAERRGKKIVNITQLFPCRFCGLPCRAFYGRCRPCMDARRSATKRGAMKVRRERIAQAGDRDIHWRTVGERDGWVCHLCRGPVSPVAGTADQPWGATVDHLVPVVEGGEHRWHNVALAHRRCNISRGARPLAEFSA